MWKADSINGIIKNKKKPQEEKLGISQTPGRQYQTALNTEQQRLPLGYNLQKFYLLAETERKREDKA